MSTNLTPSEVDQLSAVNITVSVISLCGALGILFFYYRAKELREAYIFRLVFTLAIADCCYSFVNAWGASLTGGACTYQGLNRVYFGLSSLFWATSIAFTLHMAVLRNDQRFASHAVGKLSVYYHAFCWGAPALLTVLPLATGSFGDVGPFCWIEGSRTVSVVWRFMSYYVWVWLAFTYNVYVYIGVRSLLKGLELTKDASNPNKSLIDQAFFYPVVMAACYLFPSAYRLAQAISPDTDLAWLYGMAVFASGIRPFCNSIVYGASPGVREKVLEFAAQFCACAERYRNLSRGNSVERGQDGGGGAGTGAAGGQGDAVKARAQDAAIEAKVQQGLEEIERHTRASDAQAAQVTRETQEAIRLQLQNSPGRNGASHGGAGGGGPDDEPDSARAEREADESPDNSVVRGQPEVVPVAQPQQHQQQPQQAPAGGLPPRSSVASRSAGASVSLSIGAGGAAPVSVGDVAVTVGVSQ